MTLRYIIQRLMQLVIGVVGISFITYIVINVLPGSTAAAILGTSATPQEVRILTKQLGLNRPVLLRYVDWLSSAVQGRLGTSLSTQQSVASLIGHAFPVTAELIVLAFVISLVTAVPIAVLAAAKPGKVVDGVSRLLATWGLSMPNFIVALILILFASVYLHLLPATGFTPISGGIGANLRSVIMPALAISFAQFGIYTRLLRADMVDQLAGAQYVVAGQAQGLRKRVIIVRHVLRNSIYGLVTVVGTNFGFLLGATVIIEQVFSLPGLGQLLISSVTDRDVPVVEGLVLVFTTFVIVLNFLAEVVHSLLNPAVYSDAS